MAGEGGAKMVELTRPPADANKTEAVLSQGAVENGLPVVKVEQALVKPEMIGDNPVKEESSLDLSNKGKSFGGGHVVKEEVGQTPVKSEKLEHHALQDVKPPVKSEGTVGESKDFQDGSQDRQGTTEKVTSQMEQSNGTGMAKGDNVGQPVGAENGELPPKTPMPAKQMSEAEILYTYILRWPKVNVISKDVKKGKSK